MYVDSHSLGQLALASKRTASYINIQPDIELNVLTMRVDAASFVAQSWEEKNKNKVRNHAHITKIINKNMLTYSSYLYQLL